MRKIFVVALVVLALALGACNNHSGCEIEQGEYTGTKDGITYIMTIDSAMGAHVVGDAYTFTVTGQGIAMTGSGKVAAIDYAHGMVIFTLQPSYPGAPVFKVNTIDIWIVFLEDTITFNGGATMKGPGSFSPIYTIANSSIPTIIMRNDGHGTGTADKGANPKPGTTVTIYATPDPGYSFYGWQVTSGDVILSPNDSTSPASFTMPANSVTIWASFIVLNPPILVSNTIYRYDDLPGGPGTPRNASVDYGNDINGNPITPAQAGTLYWKYVDSNGVEYSYLLPPTEAGIYGIYVSTTGGSYPAVTDRNIGTLTINKAPGAAVDTSSPWAMFGSSPSYNSIRITAATLVAGTTQSVEYAVSTTGSAPSSGWQSGLIFSDLIPETNYYVFARSQENNNYEAGPPIAMSGSPYKTEAAPAIRIKGGDIFMFVGESPRTLGITGGDGSGVTWGLSPGSASVAAVSGDILTPAGPGIARLTATQGGNSDSVIVTVQSQSWLTDINGQVSGKAETANTKISNVNAADGKFTLQAKGHIDVNLQIFGFLYLPASGDFTMTVRLDSVYFGIGGGTSSVAGLLAIPRETLPLPGLITQDPMGTLSNYPTDVGLLYASAFLLPAGGTTRHWYRRERSAVGNYTEKRIGNGTATDAALKSGRWLKLRRDGDDFYSAYSENGGASWVEESTTVVMDTNTYVGVWVAAGKNASQYGGYTIADFSEWSLVDGVGKGDAPQTELNLPGNRVNISKFE